MVRIRQTARMSTGGKQPRRRLVPLKDDNTEQVKQEPAKSDYVNLRIQIPSIVKVEEFKLEEEVNKRQKINLK